MKRIIRGIMAGAIIGMILFIIIAAFLNLTIEDSFPFMYIIIGVCACIVSTIMYLDTY
jgi:uncharacterized SAM-binding protein YcdF (DUF218 family)